MSKSGMISPKKYRRARLGNGSAFILNLDQPTNNREARRKKEREAKRGKSNA